MTSSRPVESWENVYFIGIGGIGMSALARYFQGKGCQVSGYDKQPTPLTRQLEAEGIAVHYTESPERVPVSADAVIYTPAIPATHAELKYSRQQGLRLMKRSEVLGLITARYFNICVAGTHGKTTISTMIAHVLRHSGYGCNAFLGGIAVNYQSNFWGHKNNVCVVEADEYDRSFLTLRPDVAVLSAMDPDHLDIYGTEEAMESSFLEFTANIKPTGLLLYKLGLKRTRDLRGQHRQSYSLDNPQADCYALNIALKDGAYHFDVQVGKTCIPDFQLLMGGRHNVENSVAAIAVASSLGISADLIRKAIAEFRGVKRRFEYVIEPGKHTQGIVMVDDYAHHPEELRALINGVREQFPRHRCTVVFQPHLYSRTRDFAKGFAAVLDQADEVILLPVYPARELPIPGVSSQLIVDQITHHPARILEKKALLDWIDNTQLQQTVLVMAGAGDIDSLAEPVRERLLKKN
ncbi:MAG: UDP-N-acetylmuramate--L-alanine ligase [Chitinophagaceae bacterium]